LDSHGSLDSQLVTAFLAVDLDAQGRVHATGPTPRLVLRDPGPRYHGLLSTWRSAGIQVDVVEPQQALAARWEKVILNATVGPLCLARGWSMAAVWATPETRALVEAASAEGCAVADACGIHLQHGVLDRAAVFFAATGAHRPSTVQGPSELPWILGYLLHRAQEHGVDTPALTAIAEPLRQSGIDVDWHEQGALSLG
jgi:ketopantoate reductase